MISSRYGRELKPMPMYNKLSNDIQEQIIEDRALGIVNPNRALDEEAIRIRPDHDDTNLWRPPYVRDCERIMHLPYYSRYADKTQVFSFYKNDDISRRSFHVQLVSRIARNIGSVLGLNLDLIEAGALGHDIGHTPLGHAGERMLSELLKSHTGRSFNHNVHSARVMGQLFNRNISLQVLDAALCHNGELEQSEYRPAVDAYGYDIKEMNRLRQEDEAGYSEASRNMFTNLYAKMDECNADPMKIKELIPVTLEGCVVRVSDIIAYLGKDRQDAIKLGLLRDHEKFNSDVIGSSNAEIINNMIVNIIENSYGKDYLSMDKDYYDAFSKAKKENFKLIYGSDVVEEQMKTKVEPMFTRVYENIREQVISKDTDSIFYRHHIGALKKAYTKTNLDRYLEGNDVDQLTVDFIASMTDDYFVDLYKELYPDDKVSIHYTGYFD